MSLEDRTIRKKHFTQTATARPAMQAMFDWNEYGVRDICGAYEVCDDGWELPVINMSAKVREMLANREFEWDERVAFTSLALASMRNILEYAAEPNEVWCYTASEMLDAFDEIAEFVYRIVHDVSCGANY